MLDAAEGLLACPVCAGPLTLGPYPVRCPSGHSFDVARQGYLNLLRSAPPAHADTPDMVSARERVLRAGVFEDMDAALADTLSNRRTVLDVGGGTGHHLARVLDATPDARGVSLDISVVAARRAARAHPRVASVVADAWGTLPVRPGVADAVMGVFAPRNPAEFARVLAPGGFVVVVIPDEEHLIELRSTYGLMGLAADKSERLQQTMAPHVDLVTRTRVRAPVNAGAALVSDLIAMGPNAFHSAPADTAPLETSIAVSIWVFRRPIQG